VSLESVVDFRYYKVKARQLGPLAQLKLQRNTIKTDDITFKLMTANLNFAVDLLPVRKTHRGELPESHGSNIRKSAYPLYPFRRIREIKLDVQELVLVKIDCIVRISFKVCFAAGCSDVDRNKEYPALEAAPFNIHNIHNIHKKAFLYGRLFASTVEEMRAGALQETRVLIRESD